MVILLADLAPELYVEIEELIRKGEYEDFTQFIKVACENQVNLKNFSESSISSKTRINHLVSRKEKSICHSEANVQTRKKKNYPKGVCDWKNLQDKGEKYIIFSEEEYDKANLAFKMPDFDSLPLSICKIDEYIKNWPWGQANRYLPMKMVVRAVANFANNRNWPHFDILRNKLAIPSMVFGILLRQSDEDKSRKRGESLSTALPHNDRENSSLRFINSFLGSYTKSGNFYPGGTFFYGFTAFSEGNLIGLTESGKEFCKLVNPILDGSIDDAESTLSEDECKWLYNYALSLPGESHAFDLIQKVLGNEELNPTDFALRVAGELGISPEDGSFKIKFNGVVSRMIELAIIARIWKGTRASYKVFNKY